MVGLLCKISQCCGRGLTMALVFAGICHAEEKQNSLIQIGEMRVAIGQQKSQGRVRLGDMTKRPHFYGVGALEGLSGEVTIVDGQIVATTVDDKGQPRPGAKPPADLQATMLVGAYVPGWKDVLVKRDVPPADFDAFVEEQAAAAGINTGKPFLFRIDGPVTEATLHVINGACPVHARLKRIELPNDKRPYEVTLEKLEGTLVGVSAKDAVGKLTHPATSTHVHLVYRTPEGSSPFTGHLEAVGLKQGAVLRFVAQ